MRWTDRQQAMLREMGLRLWLPGEPAAEAEAASAAAVAVAVTALGPTLVPAPAPAPAPAFVPAASPATEPAAGTAQSGPSAATVAKPAAHATAPAKTLPAGRPPQRTPEHALRATPHHTPTAAADTTATAVAAMDWPALREAVAGCQACGLCASRQQTVFGVGNLSARLMVVGEAPGEHEDQRGEPFVGAAGQMLDRMLAALGLGRDPALAERQVFIANALKCRPPRNRNPAPDELSACQPYLARQVALVQPRVILAMGAFAVQSLLGSDAPIGRLRGQVHRWQGVPLVVTYHPAYLLRQGAHKARAWDDLCLAAQVLEAGPGR